MSQINQSGPVYQPSPEDIAMYKQQFNEGLNLFKNALEEHHKADEEHKKARFEDVMSKALNVLNETSSAVLKKQGQKLEDQLAKDYNIYIHDESDDNYKTLKGDIDKLQGKVK